MRKAIIASSLLATVFALTSCSEKTVLAIAVSNIPPGSANLLVTATVDENTKPYKTEAYELKTTNSTIIGIEVPDEYKGNFLNVKIIAAGDPTEGSNDTGYAKTCNLAQWSGSIPTVSSGIISTSANLQPMENDQVTADLFSVVSKSSTDVYAAGTSGTIVHWDGCTWKKKSFNDGFSTVSINKLYYHQKTGLWGLANSGTIIKYDEPSDKWNTVQIPSNLFTGTGEFQGNISWISMLYLNNTAGDFIISGVAPGLATPSMSVCYVLKGTPNGSGGYNFSRLDSAMPLCRVKPASAPPQIPSRPNYSDYYYNPYTFTSTANGDIISGGILNIIIQTTQIEVYQHAAFQTYDSQLKPYNPPEYIVVTDGTGIVPSPTAAVVWGKSINNFWVGSTRLFHIDRSQSQPIYTTKIYQYNPNTYKFISLWGIHERDLWSISMPANRFSQVLHIADNQQSGIKFDPSQVGLIRYDAGIDNYPITAIDGIIQNNSSNDIWLIGYGGVRIHYNGSSFNVMK